MLRPPLTPWFVLPNDIWDEYKLWSSSLYNFLHSIVRNTSSYFSPNILLRTLFSKTLSLFSSLNVMHRVSHPYKTTGRITALYILTFRSRGTSVSIMSGYGLDDSAIEVRSLAEAREATSCVRASSGAHPASCTMGTGGHFPWGKERPGRDADHSYPSSVGVVNE
jgi:hypothetical protein